MGPLPTAPKLGKADEDASIKRFAQDISRALGKHISEQDYPRLARERGWQGTTDLRLTIGPDGKLKDIVVQSSSNYDILDQRALEKLKALVLPRVPAEMKGRAFTVRIPVKFALREIEKK